MALSNLRRDHVVHVENLRLRNSPPKAGFTRVPASGDAIELRLHVLNYSDKTRELIKLVHCINSFLV